MNGLVGRANLGEAEAFGVNSIIDVGGVATKLKHNRVAEPITAMKYR